MKLGERSVVLSVSSIGSNSLQHRERFVPSADQVWEWAIKQIKNGKGEYNTFWRIISGLVEKLEEQIERCEEQKRIISRLNYKLGELEHKLKKSNGWGYVYLMEGGGYYKIGLSVRPPQRSFDISPKMPFEVKLVHIIESDNARKLETELHQRFERKHLRGEWFNLTPDDVKQFKLL